MKHTLINISHGAKYFGKFWYGKTLVKKKKKDCNIILYVLVLFFILVFLIILDIFTANKF